MGGTPELFPVLAGLAHAKIVRGHMREARALAEEFLELAGPQQDSLVMMAGHWLLAYAAWWQGDVVDVRDHSRQGLAFYNPDQHRAGIAAYNINPRIVCGYLSALADWCSVTQRRRRTAWSERSRTRTSSSIPIASAFHCCSPPSYLNFGASPSPRGHERKRRER